MYKILIHIRLMWLTFFAGGDIYTLCDNFLKKKILLSKPRSLVTPVINLALIIIHLRLTSSPFKYLMSEQWWCPCTHCHC